MQEIKEEGEFRYVEEGEGDVIILLHGLFGALSNFHHLVESCSKKYKIIIPILPLYELPVEESTVSGMVKYVDRFLKHKQYKNVVLLGNSLGGHIALLYTLEHPEQVRSIVLTGSSGLFESAMGDSYPKKQDYDYIKKKTEYTFYNPKVATKELVDEVYEIVNNRNKAIRILYIARSAIRHNLRDDLEKIKIPALIIWGKNDRITPPFVGEEFSKLLPMTELKWIDRCGHVAMMEHPETFNQILLEFLEKIKVDTPLEE